MGLTNLLVTIVILALIFGLVYWVVGMITLPAPVKTAINVVLVTIAVLVLISLLTGGVSLPIVRVG